MAKMSVAVAIDTSSSSSNNSLSLTRIAGAANHSRRVSIIEEDSRECPTQEASEIERGNNYHLGFDERRRMGQHQGILLQTNHPMGGFHHHRQPPTNRQLAFRERRDSNSFDCKFFYILPSLPWTALYYEFALIISSNAVFNYECTADSDSEDEFVIHRKLLRRRHVRKYQLQKERERKQQQLSTVAAAVEVASRNNLAISNNNNSKNKRKSPSPVVGEEPPQATHEDTMEEAVSMDEEDYEGTPETDTETSFDDSTTFDPSPEIEDEYDTMMLPSLARRMSLCPVSRRLACQFDSISFFSPVKPSKSKRRKVLDTSAMA